MIKYDYIHILTIILLQISWFLKCIAYNRKEAEKLDHKLYFLLLHVWQEFFAMIESTRPRAKVHTVSNYKFVNNFVIVYIDNIFSYAIYCYLLV